MILKTELLKSFIKHCAFYVIVVAVFLISCKEKSINVNDKKAAATTTNLKWVDYRIGEPPPAGYYNAFDSVIKKWHIRFERIEGGCEGLPEERRVYEKDNPKYFRVLEKRFGKDWLKRFYKEVKNLEKKTLSPAIGNQTIDQKNTFINENIQSSFLPV